MTCKTCGKRAYSEYCVRHKPRKPIPKIGKRTTKYKEWRDTTAIPFLSATYGHRCAVSGCLNQDLDVDHILNRGSHPELVMSLDNVQWLCRTHHQQKTDGKL